MSDGRATSIVDTRIGQRVRARRLAIDMSQERLAEILGVTFQQVQKYEKGVNRIAASRLFDISRALDIPIAQFFEGLGSTAKSPTSPGQKSQQDAGLIDDVLATPEGANLVGLFATINNQIVRRRVVRLVRALTEASDRS